MARPFLKPFGVQVNRIFTIMNTKYFLRVNGLVLEISGVTFYNIQEYLNSEIISYKETEIKEVKVDPETCFKTEELSRTFSISADDFETMIRKATISFPD